MTPKLHFIIILLLQILSTYCWGSNGHQITGLVAQQFLSQASLSAIKTILDPIYNGYFVNWQVN